MTKEGPVTKGKGGGGGGVGKGPRHLHPRGPRVRQLRGNGKAKEAGDAVDHADIWTARIPTAKRLHSLQPLQATTGMERPLAFTGLQPAAFSFPATFKP